MNTEKVISIAQKTFGEIHPVKDNLYRGEIRINNKSAGSYFLDFNQDIGLQNFSDYQETLLANEYYNLPSSLQWNFYLFLLRDNIDLDFKLEVEKNDRYARKFVFNESEFEDYFNIDATSSVVNYDIISELIRKLDEAHLYEVYSNGTLTGTVENFILNKSFKRGKVIESNTTNLSPSKIDFINRLKICPNYREYPKKPRLFEFGKVNLLKGINGVGKTSLLEAIELIICGRTLRNHGYTDENECVEARFNNSILDNKFINDNKLYQSRDAAWYSRSYSRDNYMYLSFNRFNFFNSDAAYTFSSSSDEKNIKAALNDLIFGSEYNYIIERIKKLFPDFRREYNKLSTDLFNASLKIKEAETIITQKSNEDSTIVLERAIEDNCNILKFKNQTFTIKSEYTIVEQFNNELQTLIEKIIENPINNILTLEGINNYLNQSKNKEDTLKDYDGKVKEVNKKIAELELELKELYDKEYILLESDKFFSDINIFKIEGLQLRLDKAKDIIKVYELVEKNLQALEINTFISDENIMTLKNKIEEELIKLKLELLESEKESKKIIDQLGLLEKLVKEIKLLGIDYLVNIENATECPLCNTQFTIDQLKSRIENLPETETNSDSLRILHDNEILIKAKISSTTKYVQDLDKLSSAFKLITVNENDNTSLNEIISSINSFLGTATESYSKKQEFESLEELTNSFNVTESEFTYVKNKISEIFHEELLFSYEHKNDFINKKSELKISIENLKKVISELIGKKEKLIAELKLMLNFSDQSLNTIEEITDKLQDEILAILKSKDFFDKIFNLIEFKENLSLDNIDIISKTLSKNIASYKAQLLSHSELEQAKKQKSQNKTFLDENSELLKRLETAFNTLKNLNEGDDKNLEEFFKLNMDEVFEIFKSIHAPDEFISIKFNNNTLYLSPKKGNPRTLSQISAGQRSALALSLFITLNRKLKNGPNIIMFDDPVAFVDDLNILSFLDYLRFFVLKENKQIFFSTANVRLASLFEKKFEFLGEHDFKRWEFRREIA